MVIVGNRGIWFGAIFPYKVNGGKWRYTFGTIFPYMVMAENKGIWFSTITEYCRCCFLVWACSLPFFYLINPMCIICMRDYSCIQSSGACTSYTLTNSLFNCSKRLHRLLSHLILCLLNSRVHSSWLILATLQITLCTHLTYSFLMLSVAMTR